MITNTTSMQYVL